VVRGRGITLGLTALLAFALGLSGAAADPPDGSNGHHHQTPTPSANPSPSPTPPGGDAASPTPGLAHDPTAGTRPPGNNGTVKIDGMPWDNAPNNEPHPGCILQIDFYGYDDGPNLWADWELVLHSPTRATTGSGIIGSGDVYIGEDQAGGGTDHDASVTVTYAYSVAETMATPHPKQGYHVKLTVHADGSIGADTKHKTFWMTCTAQVLPTTVTPPPTTGPLPTSAPPGPAVPPTVLPSIVRPPNGLAFTGSDPGRRMAIALALLLFGTAALRASRLRQRRHYHSG